jgi:hypothetical protein
MEKKKLRPRYRWKPHRTNTFTQRDWVKFFYKYINSKSEDFPKFWEMIGLKIFDLLLKDYCVRIPHVGIFEVVVMNTKRDAILKNDKPCWKYPKSELMFVPDPNFKKIFNDKFFPDHEIRQLQEKKFDWMKKLNDKTVYERR